MKVNFPNLAKEIDFQEVQETQRVPKKLDPRRNTPRHIIITLPKIKDKDRNLEAAREKDTVTYKGVSIRLSADFSKEILQAGRGWKEVFQVMKGKDLHLQRDLTGKKGLARSIPSHERQGPTSKITVSSKAII